MSDNETPQHRPALKIAEELNSRAWNLDAGELRNSFLDLVGAVIAIAREVANAAATANRANDRLDSINEGCKQLMDETRANEAKCAEGYSALDEARAVPGTALDACIDAMSASTPTDAEVPGDIDVGLSRLIAGMQQQTIEETREREFEHARQYQTRASIAEGRLDLMYFSLVELWRTARCAEEDAQAQTPAQLRKALVAFESRLRVMLEAAGKLPPE